MNIKNLMINYIWYSLSLIVNFPFLIKDLIIFAWYKIHQDRINLIFKHYLSNVNIKKVTYPYIKDLGFVKISIIESEDPSYNFPLVLNNIKHDLESLSKEFLIRPDLSTYNSLLIEANIKVPVILSLHYNLASPINEIKFLHNVSNSFIELDSHGISNMDLKKFLKRNVDSNFKFLKCRLKDSPFCMIMILVSLLFSVKSITVSYCFVIFFYWTAREWLGVNEE